jgi:hypothetical protein
MYRKRNSFFYIFSSFFGALMVAAAFFYYNYRFSQFKFLDFSNEILYEKNAIFEPKVDEYTLLIFSSKISNIDTLLSKIDQKYPIIAIDVFQKRFENRKNVIFVTTGINRIIKIIQKLNINEVPVVVGIKRYNKNLFKQDTILEVVK